MKENENTNRMCWNRLAKRTDLWRMDVDKQITHVEIDSKIEGLKDRQAI